MYKSSSFNRGITAFVAASTNEISGSFLALKGVGTTIKYVSASTGVIAAFKYPFATALATALAIDACRHCFV